MTGELAFGPAMSALTPLQQSFIEALLQQNGQMNYTKAYLVANPDVSRDVAQAASSRLMSQDHILLALHEEADKRLRAGALLGVSVMMEIAADPTHKDRLRAAGMIADRVGFHAKTEHKVTVEKPTDDIEIVQRIVDLGKSLGLSDEAIKGMIGNNVAVPIGLLAAPGDSNVVDAEYEEVGTSDGLEGVL